MADCLLAVCRVADELQLPILADLITLRERMWGRLLDHSQAERLHVPETEYPQHMISPIPSEPIGALMRGREWQYRARSPEEVLTADLEDAEGTCRNLITLRAHMLVRHQFGSDIDWHIQFFEDKESTVSLNFQPFLRNLAIAYRKTGDLEVCRARRASDVVVVQAVPGAQPPAIHRPVAHPGSGRPTVARVAGCDRLPGPDRAVR